MASGAGGPWGEQPVDHFLRAGHIAARDGAAVRWFHAANSRARAEQAARSDVHMVEVDVVLRGGDGDPVLAHPPDTDSDITLQEWLALMVGTNKGIKLDFKSTRGGIPLALTVPCICEDIKCSGRVRNAAAHPVTPAITGFHLESLSSSPPGRRGTLSGAAGAGGAAAGQTRVAERGHPARGLRTAGRPRLPACCHLLLPQCHPVPGLDHGLPPRPRVRVAHGAGDVAAVPAAVPAGDVRGQGCAGARVAPAAAVAAAAVPQIQPHCLDRKGRCVYCRRFASHPRKF